ncbi:hypothetical protein [Alkalicoccobacillus porphyridii]|uniref:Uncharacterized protein n=1 Tax=Alkalicoccobacillus porphyridii TaxID=2597270 RepID=A0A554A3C2_9BACI|nr:hypothetical protein [Alkalicoccobacillus porphyridii]TSB48190.1 hypothetical protein FN960_01150 [Alkalicoccobacillus porphyridii]
MYKAKESKFLWLLLLITSLVYAFFLDGVYQLLAVVVAAIFAVIMFSHYTLSINENSITFSWYLAGLRALNREIPASSMKRITFITSIRQTLALVELHKGFRVKLHRFRPDGYIEELKSFTDLHQVDKEETSFLKQDQ